jgi:hypothetical protein
MEKQEEKKVTKYDGVSITELETKIEKLHILSREHQKEMYECLEYLRTSYRYKENPHYKKSSFWAYLEDRFTIREGTYRENVRAFSKFPTYAIEYGVGMVAKIDRVCGGMKVDKVISEIQHEAAAHKTPMSRKNMETIIEKYRKTPKVKREITDWKAMYEHEKATHDKTKEALRVAMKKINELNEQIEKLKVTAQTVTSIRKLFDKHNNTIQRSATL